MLSNQKLFAVNHFALEARRHGMALPELDLLLSDETLLRSIIESALKAPQAAVVQAARTVAGLFAWRPAEPAADGGPSTIARGPASIGDYDAPMTSSQRTRAQRALLAVAGPIAPFIAEQVAADPGCSLRRFLEEAADLAQLPDDKRRALYAAVGLTG